MECIVGWCRGQHLEGSSDCEPVLPDRMVLESQHSVVAGRQVEIGGKKGSEEWDSKTLLGSLQRERRVWPRSGWGTWPVMNRSHHRERRQEVFPGASGWTLYRPHAGPELLLGCLFCTSSHLLASRVSGFPTPSSLRKATGQQQLWSRLINCFPPSSCPSPLLALFPQIFRKECHGSF